MAESITFSEKLLDAIRTAGMPLPEHQWAPGQLLFRQGFPPGGVVVVTKGLSKVSVGAFNGAELLFGLVGPGRILGDLEYFRSSEAVCSVTALEPVTGFYFKNALIPTIRKACPDFDLILGKSLAAKLAENTDRIERNFCYPLDYNILVAAFYHLGTDERPVHKTELMGYLGVSARHLNRVIADLVKEGLVRSENGYIVVKNEKAIRARIAKTESE